MRRALVLLFAACVFTSQVARADNPTKEFIMSCTYGVLAGTLVGAASLAFVNKPADNMFRVARGASIGLYTGILLGLYVVYIVPGMSSDEEEQVRLRESPPFLISPVLAADSRLDGARADLTILRF